MKIEVCTEAHIDELMHLGRAMYAESALGGVEGDEERARRTFLAAIRDETGVYCLLLARAGNGEAAGFLFGTITRPWFTSALIAHDHAFFVMPAYRGSSAALKVLRVFRRWADKRGAACLNVSQRVGVETDRFDRLMTRLGFEARGTNFSLSLR